MAAMTCPHCHEVNAQAGPFCEYCGKAMPSQQTGGPRVIDKDGLAQTSAGRELQSDELHKQTKKAAGALLTVAILQTIGAVIIYFLLRSLADNAEVADAMAEEGLDASAAGVISVIAFAVAGIFYGLWWWSRTNPLPAAIVGLVIYGSLLFLDFLADPGNIARGIIIKIIIIAMLIRAIQAGVKHRQLLREGAAAV